MRARVLLLAAGLALAGCTTGPPPVKPTSGDLARLYAAERDALDDARTGQSVNWSNPQTGHRGSITVLGTNSGGDRRCRTVQRVFNAGETTRTAKARACRRADSGWEIVESAPLRSAAERWRARHLRMPLGYGTGVHYGLRYHTYRYGWPHPLRWSWGPPYRGPD
jgi:hypothetical protein